MQMQLDILEPAVDDGNIPPETCVASGLLVLVDRAWHRDIGKYRSGFASGALAHSLLTTLQFTYIVEEESPPEVDESHGGILTSDCQHLAGVVGKVTIIDIVDGG